MLAELRITPVDSKVSFPRLLADLVPVFSQSPLQYQVHAMGTTLEGDLDEILAVVRRCHAVLQTHTRRVLLQLSLDDRPGLEGEMARSLYHLREALPAGVPIERFLHQERRVQ